MKNHLFQKIVALNRQLIFSLFVCISTLASAQQCPSSDSSPRAVSNAISDFQKNDRSPAGADCAYQWLIGYSIEGAKLNDELLTLFRLATDVQRRAAEKRHANPHFISDEIMYSDHEIELRRHILAAITDIPESDTPKINNEIKIHINYLVDALAKRQQYKVVDDMLADRAPQFIHPEALKVWLQAIWSCTKFDGNMTNLCEPQNQGSCKEKVKIFLSSVEQMKKTVLTPRTKSDIDRLRQLTSTNGCLK